MRAKAALTLVCALSWSLATANEKIEKYLRAVKAYDAQNYQTAAELFHQFIKEQPYEPEVRKAWFYLAKIAALLGNCHEAIARANITLDRYGTHPDRNELLLINAECYYQLGNHRRAEEALGQMRQTQDTEQKLRSELLRGYMAFEARAFSRAQKHYRAAIGLAEKLGSETKDVLRAYAELGEILSREPQNAEAAISILSRAIILAQKVQPSLVRTLKLKLNRLTLRRLDKLHGLGDNSVADIRVDGDDVYIATWGAGLVRYMRSKDKLEKIPLPVSQLRGLFVDFDTIYIASFDGIYLLDKKSSKITTLTENNQALQLAQKIIKDDRYIYCSTLSRGLVRYDTIKKTTVILGKDSWVKSDQVYALDADVDYIAVGTIDQGALIHHKASGETIQITAGEGGLQSENVKAVLLDGRFVHIAAHNDGVYTYDLQQRKLRKIETATPFPSALAKRDHEIFIGTSGQGIWVLDRNTGKVERLSSLEGLSSNDVHTIRIEGDFLWIGYLEQGIDVLYR
ncbi:MAG: tetratricopeptide repeat protein, partial [Turneriella sp.]|nr:tetratricopeptide repeat protein [Turneriella sp.]